MEPERRVYLLANSPEWLLVAIAIWIAARHFEVSWWVAAGVLVFWIAKDLLLFRVMRRYYRSSPSERRIVGARGVALSPLAPRGFVRVRGEIWQAESAGVDAQFIPEGTNVRVHDVQGLLLFVERS